MARGHFSSYTGRKVKGLALNFISIDEGGKAHRAAATNTGKEQVTCVSQVPLVHIVSGGWEHDGQRAGDAILCPSGEQCSQQPTQNTFIVLSSLHSADAIFSLASVLAHDF